VSVADASWSGAGCPDAEQLAGLLVDELPEGERQRLADHVVGCQRCTTDFRLLRDVHRAARGGQPAARRRVWLAAAAAAVVLTVGGGLLLVPPAPDAIRGTGLEPLPADGATLDAAPLELSWAPQPGARGYRVRLYRHDGDLLWEGPTTPAPGVPLPGEARALVAPGESAFWTVEVDGRVSRRRLGPFWFEVRVRTD
jgi:hypothetical protein